MLPFAVLAEQELEARRARRRASPPPRRTGRATARWPLGQRSGPAFGGPGAPGTFAGAGRGGRLRRRLGARGASLGATGQPGPRRRRPRRQTDAEGTGHARIANLAGGHARVSASRVWIDLHGPVLSSKPRRTTPRKREPPGAFLRGARRGVCGIERRVSQGPLEPAGAARDARLLPRGLPPAGVALRPLPRGRPRLSASRVWTPRCSSTRSSSRARPARRSSTSSTTSSCTTVIYALRGEITPSDGAHGDGPGRRRCGCPCAGPASPSAGATSA